ncbi:MAG: hypothetical protein HY290_33450 [Planctomycetia bacterium]|nr:hypothetical protein [Planctomycetia bacterium]
MPTSNLSAPTTEPTELRLLAPSVEIEAALPEGEPQRQRRFQMVAYTGGPMMLAGWRYPVVVDLNGLDVGKQRRPILLDHTRDVEFVMGQTDQIVPANNQLLVTGQIMGDSPRAKQVIALNDKGFSWQASIGAKANQVEFVAEGRSVEVNGREVAGPVNVARRASLGEISFVVLGADENTTAQIAAKAKQAKEQPMEFAEWVEAQGFAVDSLSEKQTTGLKALYEQTRETPAVPVVATPPATVPAPSPTAPAPAPALAVRDTTPVDPVADLRARLASEQRRVDYIVRTCQGDQFGEMKVLAIAEGWDATRLELEMLRAGRPKGAAPHSPAENTQMFAAIEAAMCISAGISEERVGKWYDARVMEAALSHDLRGAGIHTLLYEVIRATGGHVRPGHVDNDTIRAAFVADGRLIQAAEGYSTLSLAGILSNLANKTLLAAYEAVNSVADQICGTTDVNDFKQVTRYRMTASGIFQKVGPDGELKHASLDSESYTNQVETYGRMIALTRQMIINDDLSAFLQIPRAIGRMSALALEEAVFTLLLANVGSFFSAGNANYFEGVDSALDVDSLTVGERMFLDRVDSKGKPILVQPAILLVPTGLKVTAELMFKETTWLNQVPANNKAKPATNPHGGKFRPVTSPYLSISSIPGNSATAWYLLAEPSDVAAIEIAYLRGKSNPTIESGESDFNTLGMQWRGYFDFGVAMQDMRAAVKSKGSV